MKFSLIATFAVSTFAFLAACVTIPAPSTISDISTYDPTIPANTAYYNSTELKRSAEERDLESRGDHLYVYVCTDINYGGKCQQLSTNSMIAFKPTNLSRITNLWSLIAGLCYNLGNGFDDSISSLQVTYNYYCIFYVDIGCDSDQSSLGVLGPQDVPWVGADMNDKFSSYVCCADIDGVYNCNIN